MNVMIIGKTGQIGSSLMNAAAHAGVQAIGYAREELDICDTMRLKKEIKAIRPSAVINASAYHNVGDCETHPNEAMRMNAVAVYELATLCRANTIIFVHYSTDYVFDGKKNTPYQEEDTPWPLQLYGVSKLAGEYAALNAHPDGTRIIRTAGVYGGSQGSRIKGGNFVLTILRDTANKDAIEVGCDQVMTTSLSDDVADATLKLIVRKAPSGIYHLTNEGTCGWHEFAVEILRLQGKGKTIIPVVRGEIRDNIRRPLYSALANTRAKALGIVLPSWQDAIARYLSFLNHTA